MKFKEKKIKLTKFEEVFISIFLLGICFFTLLFPLSTNDDSIVNNQKTYDNKKYTLNDFSFEGEKYYEHVFGNIGEIVNNNNGKYESHFVNLNNKKELSINDLIKEDNLNDFNRKIESLLSLKYPKKYISTIMSDSDITYIFKENNLFINFNGANDLLDVMKDFNLTVDYNEIWEYLDFDVDLNKEYHNETGYSYDPSKVSIVFSFDDGPNGDRTKKIVNALEDYKMSATFFIVGNKIENYEDTVKFVYNSHSEMGYHSLNHMSFATQSINTIKKEFQVSDSSYNKITGDHFKLVRPPYGSFNSDTLKALDIPFLKWNIDTNDWQYKDVDHIVNEVLDNYQEGSIILMHDSYDTTVEATISLIDELYKRNVQVLSVSDYAKLRNINLEAHTVYYYFEIN